MRKVKLSKGKFGRWFIVVKGKRIYLDISVILEEINRQRIP